MKTYQFQKRVDENGTINLFGLPPNQNVEIVVLHPELSDTKEEMIRWLNKMKKTHPFADMSKEEILEKLRETRNQVWEEHYANQH